MWHIFRRYRAIMQPSWQSLIVWELLLYPWLKFTGIIKRRRSGEESLSEITQAVYEPRSQAGATSTRCHTKLFLNFICKLFSEKYKIVQYIYIICFSVIVKVKVWTLVITPLTWIRLVTSSALQSRKWQLIGMSQCCRSTLCGHPLPSLTDNWTHGAASRHTIAPISHTRPSSRSRSYYSFPVPLRVGGGWVGLSTQ